MNNIETPNELLNLGQNFYSKVIEQVLKDFNLSGIPLEMNESIRPEQLLKYINIRIEDLMKNDPEKIRALLYRVDIDENLVNKKVLTDNETSLTQELCKLIILRIIKKVESRSKYT